MNDHASKKVAASAKKTVDDKRADLVSKRWFDVLRALSDKIDETHPTQMTAPATRPVLYNIAAIIMCLGCEAPYGEGIDEIDDTLNNYDEDKVGNRLWELVAGRITGTFYYNGPVTQVPDKKVKNARYFARLLQIDIDAMYRDACEKHPEPKSWRKETLAEITENAKNAWKKESVTADTEATEEEPAPVKKGRGRPIRTRLRCWKY